MIKELLEEQDKDLYKNPSHTWLGFFTLTFRLRNISHPRSGYITAQQYHSAKPNITATEGSYFLAWKESFLSMQYSRDKYNCNSRIRYSYYAKSVRF